MMELVARRSFMLGAGAACLAAPVFASRRAFILPDAATSLPSARKKAEVLPLWESAPPTGGFLPQPRPADLAETFLTNIANPELHVFRARKPNGRAILVIPGGAYKFISILNEGVDIARTFTSLGYAVFVLSYRLPGEGWINRADVPLEDAQRAMRLIRHNAARFHVNAGNVAVVGFSAGGHLAASLLTGHAERLHEPRDAADSLSARPAFGGLIYPVISLTPPFTHQLSAQNLLGPNPSDQLIERRSPALHVTDATPPVFLVHASDDEAVPVENSFIMMDALKAKRRPIEVHLFEEGGHGFGLGPRDTPAREWTALFAAWLDRSFLSESN